MNKVVLIGRLTRDPEVRYSNGESATCIARYTLAVDRRFKNEGQASADFIPCTAFGKAGEFAEKYLAKGMKIAIVGRIQTGSYTNKDGKAVFTTDVIIEEQEFVESKNAASATPAPATQTAPHTAPNTDSDGFMYIPDGIDSELPFN